MIAINQDFVDLDCLWSRNDHLCWVRFIMWNFVTYYRNLYCNLKNTFFWVLTSAAPYHSNEKIYRSKILGNWVYFKFLYNRCHVKTGVYGDIAKKFIGGGGALDHLVNYAPPLSMGTFSMLFVDIYRAYSMKKFLTRIFFILLLERLD